MKHTPSRSGLGLALLAIALAGCAPAMTRSGPTSDAVLARIPISDFGTGIAITPDGLHAYVAASAKIFAIDTRTNQVVATITTGNAPYAIAISRDGKRGYAVDLMQQQFWILDLETNTLAQRIWMGEPKEPVLRPGVTLSADDTRALFTISQPTAAGQGDTIRWIDTAGGRVEQRGLDFHPGSIVTGPRPGSVVVTGCDGFCSDGTLHYLDPSMPTPFSKVQLQSVPGGLALSPDGTRAFVGNSLSASVSDVDIEQGTIRATIKVGPEPLGVAFRPDGNYVYVTNFQGGSISAIDARTDQVVATVPIGPTPRAIAVHPSGRIAYVTSSESVVYVIDLAKVTSGG